MGRLSEYKGEQALIDRDAQLLPGGLYETETILLKDIEKAKELYKKSMDQGNVVAESNYKSLTSTAESLVLPSGIGSKSFTDSLSQSIFGSTISGSTVSVSTSKTGKDDTEVSPLNYNS